MQRPALRAAADAGRWTPDEMDDVNVDLSIGLFLGHSPMGKAVVRPLAGRLRANGLKVWSDEWVLMPGDSIPKYGGRA